ncbi:hypothetical protein MHK_003333 [Candidatus Magnetomorum sp. HK-1]|nr:hypothetical protein MHK_003333 [Candidatus Magnetomorum sp. HK-1]
MDDMIVIFSPDSIRGNIIHKSLYWHGYSSKLFNKLYETEAAILSCQPVLLVVDTVDCLSKTIIFLKTLNQNQPNLKIIKLIDSQTKEDLDRHGISINGCYSEPFEPEVFIDNIIEIVKDAKASKSSPTDKMGVKKIEESFFEKEIPPFFQDIELRWYEKLLYWIRDLTY